MKVNMILARALVLNLTLITYQSRDDLKREMQIKTKKRHERHKMNG